MNKYYEELQSHIDKISALSNALTLFSWDNETLAPQAAIDLTSKTIGVLSSELQQLSISDKLYELLTKLSTDEEQASLSENEIAIVKNLLRSYKNYKAIPADEFREYNELLAKAYGIWQRAKKNKCFKDFEPTLQSIIDYNKRFAGYRRNGDQKLYDVLLDDYEKGFTVEVLDSFFDKIKKELVPIIKEAVKKHESIDKSYNTKNYPTTGQAEFCRFVAAYEGFDFERGVMAETEHPFTSNLHNHDVRITTHYYENCLESSIFSTIHETGHALYELNIDDELTLTPVGTGTSMGAHESQSRFWENIIGRSKPFWIPIWDKLVSIFPEQLNEVTLDDFIAGINKPELTLVRTEADELTYPLHILIRYEMEQLMFSDDFDLDTLPEIWNKKYEEYLGVKPADDSEGILQDVHWAGGMLGYFPSYAIGSAVAAQLYYHIREKMPFDKYLEDGNLEPIREYLKEHFHRFGATKTTNELLKQMTGEEFNADYYIKYLREKYC